MPDMSKFETPKPKKRPLDGRQFSFSYIKKTFKFTDKQMVELLCTVMEISKEELEKMIKEAMTIEKIKTPTQAMTYLGKTQAMWKINNVAEAMAKKKKPKTEAKISLKAEEINEMIKKPSLPKAMKKKLESAEYEFKGECVQCGETKEIDELTECCKECDEQLGKDLDQDKELIVPIPEALETMIKEKIADKEKLVHERKQEARKKMLQLKEESEQIEESSESGQFIPSYIILANGLQGSGKSSFGLDFETPFVVDFEDKLKYLIAYSEDPKIKNMKKAKNVYDIKADDDYVVALAYNKETGDPDLVQTWNNALEIIRWYREYGYSVHKSIVIDVGHLLRESRTAVEEKTKGRQITQFEYRPVTGDNKKLLIGLKLFCSEFERNLIIVTHWAPDYLSVENAAGYRNSIVVGRSPDVKPWIQDMVTWRIDFLKPEESGFPSKFIVYFDKSPKHQYSKVDITNKNLFEIINDPELFTEEVESFAIQLKKKRLAEKEKK